MAWFEYKLYRRNRKVSGHKTLVLHTGRKLNMSGQSVRRNHLPDHSHNDLEYHNYCRGRTYTHMEMITVDALCPSNCLGLVCMR